jgi:NADH-quinone oxidoreductase subunit C
MQLADIPALIQNHTQSACTWDEKNNQITVEADQLVAICDLLWRHPETYFDSLSCLTAIDLGPEQNQIEVIYTLYSIPKHVTVHLKVVTERDQAVIPSVSSIWKTADWHEREAYDLVGVQFLNHPNLTRILLPADWEGHPLRKDYVEQERYHGIQVKY